MTVEELIELLKGKPKDWRVITWEGFVETVGMVNYPLGDPANPNCEYEKVVRIE